jgi:hypothetical protein
MEMLIDQNSSTKNVAEAYREDPSSRQRMKGPETVATRRPHVSPWVHEDDLDP